MYSGETTGLGISAIISEIESRHATGTLVCQSLDNVAENESFSKSLFFSSGVFCAASSTLSDDRLGEILYRKGILSLDTFVSIASEVNTNLRFGEILVERGLMTSRDLWSALSDQSRSILWTLFRYDALAFEFRPSKSVLEDRHALPFDLDTECERARDYALDLRRFRSEIEKVSQIQVSDQSRELAHLDFFNEMLDIISNSSSLSSYFEKSGRPTAERALDDLFTLYIEGLVSNALELDWFRFPKGLAADLDAILEWSSLQIAVLAEVARGVSADCWPTILRGVRSLLSEDLVLLCPIGESGTLNKLGIVRTLRYRSEMMSKIGKKAGRSVGDPVTQYVRRAAERSILYILFELYNRKAASRAVLSVHRELDAQRARWI